MKPSTMEWFRAAELDLLTMEKLLGDQQLTAVLAFHAQQLVEKVFKAVLEEHGVEVFKVHSLLALWKRVKVLLRDLTLADETILLMLDQLYIDARYPGELGLLPQGAPSVADARMFYEFARDLKIAIQATLRGEGAEG